MSRGRVSRGRRGRRGRRGSGGSGEEEGEWGRGGVEWRRVSGSRGRRVCRVEEGEWE